MTKIRLNGLNLGRELGQAAQAAVDAVAAAVAAQKARDQASQIALGNADQTLATAVQNPNSLTGAALAASYAARVSVLNDVDQYGAGHSYVAAQTQYAWPKLIAGDFRTRYTNLAQSGDTTIQTVQRLFGGVGGLPTYPVNSLGIVLIQDMLNSVRKYSTASTGLSEVSNSLQCLFSLFASYVRLEPTTSGAMTPVAGGSWQILNGAAVGASGNNVYFTAADGDAIDISWFGKGCDIVAWLPHNVSVSYTVSVDGGAPTSSTVNNPGTGVIQSYTPYVLARISGVGVGSHTARIKKTSGNQLAIDCALPRMPAPPQVFIVKDPKIIGWGLDAANGNNNGSDAAMDLYWGVVDTLATIYPNVHPVAVDAWNKSTMMSADQIHPNARGHRTIADAAEAVIAQNVSTYMNGVHENGVF